jgi:hypothetical protein
MPVRNNANWLIRRGNKPRLFQKGPIMLNPSCIEEDYPFPVVSVGCTSEALFANHELLGEYIPKGSHVLDFVIDESDEHGQLTVILPKAFAEIADKIESGISRILQGQKVSRTWLN